MKIKALFVCVLLAGAMAFAQAQPKAGVGFRLGDLTGISVKGYFGDNALELSIGRLLRYGHPNRQAWFYDFDDYDPDVHVYDRSSIGVPLALQLHYIKHRDLGVLEPMKWYYGIGGQARMFPVEYTYFYRVDNSGLIWEERAVTRRSYEAGVDWVLGLEYNFENVPIGLYLDATLYMEVFDDPFVAWGLFGIGARYNF